MLEPFVFADAELSEDSSPMDDVTHRILACHDLNGWWEKEGPTLIRLVLEILET